MRANTREKSMINAKIMVLGVCVMLTACAMSPEQRARYEAQKAWERRELEIRLSAQCNPEVAEIMRASDLAKMDGNRAEEKKLALRYRKAVSDPLFRNCMQMAWQNHMNQTRLESELRLEQSRRRALEREIQASRIDADMDCREVRKGESVYLRCSRRRVRTGW